MKDKSEKRRRFEKRFQEELQKIREEFPGCEESGLLHYQLCLKIAREENPESEVFTKKIKS